MNKTWRKDRARLVDATWSSYRDSRALSTSWGQHHLVFWEKGVPSHSWDFWLFSGTRWEERTATCCTHGAPNSLGLPPSHRLWIFSGERKRPLRRPIVMSQKKKTKPSESGVCTDLFLFLPRITEGAGGSSEPGMRHWLPPPATYQQNIFSTLLISLCSESQEQVLSPLWASIIHLRKGDNGPTGLLWAFNSRSDT